MPENPKPAAPLPPPAAPTRPSPFREPELRNHPVPPKPPANAPREKADGQQKH